MRKLIIILLLAISSVAQAQVDYFTMPMPGIGAGNCGLVEHIAPVNPNGSKNPWIIWVHGQEGNASPPINSGDTTRIDNVVLKGVPKLVLSNPLPYFQIPGTVGASGLRRFNVIAPQNASGLWSCERLLKAIEHIHADHATDSDTSLIVMFGYSLGGGGIQSCLRMPGILPYIKYAAIIAPGYTQTADFPLLAASGVPVDMFAAVNDELAWPTKAGCADTWVTGLKAQNPIVVPNYFRFADLTASTATNAEHNLIVQIIAEDTITGDTYPQTNGNTWTRDETIYERALRFYGPRRTLNGLWLLMLPSLFLKRKRR